MKKQQQYQFFNFSEFDSPDLPGSGVNMRAATLDALDKARGIAGIPFVINSGFRTAAYNKRVGGARNSAHLRGFAADIRCQSQSTFETVVMACMMAGFKRFGFGTGFLHVDNDPSLPEPAFWIYDNSNPIQSERRIFAESAFKMWNFVLNR